jgi:L-aminopeptidase/D-esterase-like protein
VDHSLGDTHIERAHMPTELSIKGLSVGHYSDQTGLTGCTVVLAPAGATASVDIRGGAPGTLETALLSPYSSVGELHAVLLTGGSAPGLGAAAGVTRYLRERGLGYRTPYARIPLVSAAVIYDLGVGRVDALPGPDDAYQAAVCASRVVEEGSVGAGTGATVGKIFNHSGMMKGGIGMATVRVGGDGSIAAGRNGLSDDGVAVTALTVVNALGDVYDEQGRILAGSRRDGRFAGSTELLLRAPSAPDFFPLENTTLSVVMTDARLDKLQCGIVARMSHDGFARAINPVHTPVDGDCVFVLATGAKFGNVFQIGVAAAEAVALSIRRAVRAARGVENVPSVFDLESAAGS